MQSGPSSQAEPPKNTFGISPGGKAWRDFVLQTERRMAETVIDSRCKCSHDRFRHCYDTVDGPCSKPDCDCEAYAPVTVETVELPEPDPDHVCERYFCPTAGETESACHGGFDVCCGQPDRHTPVEPCQHGEELVSECPCSPLCECCPAQAMPPQPERRPPLTVQYAVAGGHPYEVSIPGDASVTAEDGVLIIKHPEAQILAITRVAPMEN